MDREKKIIKIAFDLDGVIIDKPPFIPKWLVEWLFRGRKINGPNYRFPKTKLERWVRKTSHHYLLRPLIKENVEYIKKLAKNDQYEFYIISGRYSFLKSRTEQWLEKHKLSRLFKKIYLNLEDDQPHLFKEKILNKLKPDIFIDDDPLLVKHLRKKISNCKLFCLTGENLGEKFAEINYHIIR